MFLCYRSSVGLIGKPADPETLHAVMRLVLRLTRDHQYAAQFATLGGSKLLLGLTQASGFQGFTSLTTLIFRHIVEEPTTLCHTLEKVRIVRFLYKIRFTHIHGLCFCILLYFKTIWGSYNSPDIRMILCFCKCSTAL